MVRTKMATIDSNIYQSVGEIAPDAYTQMRQKSLVFSRFSFEVEKDEKNCFKVKPFRVNVLMGAVISNADKQCLDIYIS